MEVCLTGTGRGLDGLGLKSRTRMAVDYLLSRFEKAGLPAPAIARHGSSGNVASLQWPPADGVGGGIMFEPGRPLPFGCWWDSGEDFDELEEEDFATAAKAFGWIRERMEDSDV